MRLRRVGEIYLRKLFLLTAEEGRDGITGEAGVRSYVCENQGTQRRRPNSPLTYYWLTIVMIWELPLRERAGRQLRRRRFSFEVEESTEKSISIDVEGLNESVTETPSVGIV